MGDRILRRYFAAAILFALFTGQADARPYQEMFPDRSDFSEAEKPLLEKLDFQQGAIKLPEAKATLNVIFMSRIIIKVMTGETDLV